MGVYSLAMASAKILSVFMVKFSPVIDFFAAADTIIEDAGQKRNDTLRPL